MKIANVKKAHELIESYNAQMKRIKAVQSENMLINFGGFDVTVARSVEADLRMRIETNLILDLERTKSEMEALGVEL